MVVKHSNRTQILNQTTTKWSTKRSMWTEPDIVVSLKGGERLDCKRAQPNKQTLIPDTLADRQTR